MHHLRIELQVTDHVSASFLREQLLESDHHSSQIVFYCIIYVDVSIRKAKEHEPFILRLISKVTWTEYGTSNCPLFIRNEALSRRLSQILYVPVSNNIRVIDGDKDPQVSNK